MQIKGYTEEYRMIGIATKVEEKLAYSVEEIAKLTTLSKPFLRNEIRAGRLKINRFGRRVLVLDKNLKDYLEGENNELEN